MISNTKRRLLPALEAMEGRRLMAADVTATLSHGVLTVTGTDTANVLIVSIQGPSRNNRGGMVRVYGLPQVFPAARVKAVEIVGGPGADAIAVLTSGRVTTPVQIDGGGGNDLINGAWSAPPAATPVVTPVVTSTDSTSVTTTPVASSLSASPKLSETEQRIVDLTNARRSQAGLAPLVVNAQLVQAARIETSEILQSGQMSHDLPGTAAPTLQDRAAAVGYHFRQMGENIASGYPDADSVVAGWMASPGHRANILNASYTQIGVSVAYDASGQAYYTQEFGEPA